MALDPSNSSNLEQLSVKGLMTAYFVVLHNIYRITCTGFAIQVTAVASK